MGPKLVQVMNAGSLTHPVKLFHERSRENLAQRPGQSLPARQGVHHFHLRVPGLDPVRQIYRHHTHTDRLDNVLVEILQPFVLGNLLLQRCVQPGVLDGDADIPGNGLKQFHVFAGQEIALSGFAQAEERDRLLLHPARDVVVQV